MGFRKSLIFILFLLVPFASAQAGDVDDSGYATETHILVDNIKIYDTDPQWECMN